MVRRRRLPSPPPRPPRPGRAEGPGRIATARQGWAAATQSNFHQELEMAKSQRKGTKEARKPKKAGRSEEHTSELQSLMRISYADFCLKKQTKPNTSERITQKEHNTTKNKKK